MASGTMRERSPGRWELRVYVGRAENSRAVDPETGETWVEQGPPIQVSRTFRGGKLAAKRALDDLVAEVRTSSTVGSKAQLSALLDRWLDDRVRLDRATSTLETYRVHVEKYIRPGLGSMRLDRLDVDTLERYFGSLAKATSERRALSAATIKLDHAVVRGALEYGVKIGWLKANPARDVELAKDRRLTKQALSDADVGALCRAALDDGDPDMAVAIALAAFSGCRRGELCGLQWRDWDEKRARLSIERQFVPGVGGQHIATPKTGEVRTTGIGTEGNLLLKRYRETKVELLGGDVDPEGWLLSYDGGTTPLRAKSVTEYVTKLGKKLGIKVTTHDLRHFKATRLQQDGVDLATAASELGHSRQVLAQTYSHSSSAQADAAGAVIGRVVGEALEVTGLLS